MGTTLRRDVIIAIIEVHLIARALDIHHMDRLHLRTAIVHPIETAADREVIGLNERAIGVAHGSTGHFGGRLVVFGTHGAPAVLVNLQTTSAVTTGNAFVIDHTDHIL